MPDWHKLLHKRLGDLKLEAGDRDEIIAELADHLEETYTSLRAQGHSQHSAFQRAVLQISDWNKLRRDIQTARQKENPMTPRAARFWLPSLVTLLVSMSMIPVLTWLGLKPQFWFLHGPHDRTYVFAVYTVWLILLPFVGALGAYLSSRSGGTRSAMVASGTFPALAFCAVLLPILLFGDILEHGLEDGARSVFESLIAEPFGRLGVLAGWVLVPGLCLLIGVFACEFLARTRVKAVR